MGPRAENMRAAVKRTARVIEAKRTARVIEARQMINAACSTGIV